MEMSLVARQEGTRHREDARRRLRVTPNSSALQNRAHLRGVDLAAQLALQPVERQLDRRRRRQLALCDRPGRPPAGCPAKPRAAIPPRAPGRAPCWPGPALSRSACDASVRSLSADEVLRTLAAWKFALSSTMRVVFAPIALSRAADHAGQRDRARRIGDHQVRRVERVRLVVQRDESLARACAGRTKIVSPVQLVAHRTRASAAPAPP